MSSLITGRRWAYVGAVLGAAVSIAANVAHSYVPPPCAPPTAASLTTPGSCPPVGWTPQPGAVLGSVFWPVAVLVALEILARVQWPTARRWLFVRWGGLAPVGLVAAVVSYRHLSGLLGFYGEDTITTTIGPLAVDGLMLLASGALLTPGRAVPATVADAPADPATDTPASVVDTAPASTPDTAPDTLADNGSDSTRRPARSGSGPRSSRSSASTADAVARLRQRHPDWSNAAIAKRLKVSERTVRRHLNTPSAGEPGADGVPAAA